MFSTGLSSPIIGVEGFEDITVGVYEEDETVGAFGFARPIPGPGAGVGVGGVPEPILLSRAPPPELGLGAGVGVGFGGVPEEILLSRAPPPEFGVGYGLS